VKEADRGERVAGRVRRRFLFEWVLILLSLSILYSLVDIQIVRYISKTSNLQIQVLLSPLQKSHSHFSQRSQMSQTFNRIRSKSFSYTAGKISRYKSVQSSQVMWSC
jgi:hypothetical protein